MSYKSKVVVVTGSGEGVGRSIALNYAENGATVVVADKNDRLGRETVDLIYDIKGSAIFITCDVTVMKDVKDLVRKVIAYYGRIDVLVNNVGMSFRKSAMDTSESEWHKVMDTNLKSVYLCVKEMVPFMKEARSGAVVNIACSGSLLREEDMEVYAAAKGGVIGMTKSLAVSLEPYNIQVNSISPGLIRTKGYQRLRSVAGQQELTLGFNRLDDVAKLCVAVTSEDNDYVNGSDLVIDQVRMRKMVHMS